MEQKGRSLDDPQSNVTLKVGLEKAVLCLEVGYCRKTELGIKPNGIKPNLREKMSFVEKAEEASKIGLGVKVV